MSVVFADEQTVFFVGGRGDQSGRLANAGGCTKGWWDTEVAASDEATAMAKLMTATGAPIINMGTADYTTVDEKITKAGISAGVEVGMVCYVTKDGGVGNVATGRYEITGIDGANRIECLGIQGTDCTVTVVIGGAFDELDNACDYTSAVVHSVWIHTNLSETLAASISISTGGHILKNLFKRIVGYNTVPGDMARGGAYYESPHEILQNGSIDLAKCVTLDGDANAFTIFSITAAVDNLIFENLHLTGTTGQGIAFVIGTSFGAVFRNCRFSDLAGVTGTGCDSLFFNSCYSHDDIIGHHYDLHGFNNVLLSCVGNLAAGTNLVNFIDHAGVAVGCVAVGGQFGFRLRNADSGGLIMGNTCYNTSVYGVVFDACDGAMIFNNIFCLAPGAIGIYSRIGGSSMYNDYNCFIESDGTPLTATGTGFAGGEAPTIGEHSIQVDPLFVDAANNNFRLQSNSPCRRVGKPGIGAT